MPDAASTCRLLASALRRFSSDTPPRPQIMSNAPAGVCPAFTLTGASLFSFIMNPAMGNDITMSDLPSACRTVDFQTYPLPQDCLVPWWVTSFYGDYSFLSLTVTPDRFGNTTTLFWQKTDGSDHFMRMRAGGASFFRGLDSSEEVITRMYGAFEPVYTSSTGSNPWQWYLPPTGINPCNGYDVNYCSYTTSSYNAQPSTSIVAITCNYPPANPPPAWPPSPPMPPPSPPSPPPPPPPPSPPPFSFSPVGQFNIPSPPPAPGQFAPTSSSAATTCDCSCCMGSSCTLSPAGQLRLSSCLACTHTAYVTNFDAQCSATGGSVTRIQRIERRIPHYPTSCPERLPARAQRWRRRTHCPRCPGSGRNRLLLCLHLWHQETAHPSAALRA